MNHWLLKSEPSAYSWADLTHDRRTAWTGVRNHQAANNLRAMRTGDRGFFYHSNEGLAIVGAVEIVREAYPDPDDKSGRFVAVDVTPQMQFLAGFYSFRYAHNATIAANQKSFRRLLVGGACRRGP